MQAWQNVFAVASEPAPFIFAFSMKNQLYEKAFVKWRSDQYTTKSTPMQ